jgi:hypothetical protein
MALHALLKRSVNRPLWSPWFLAIAVSLAMVSPKASAQDLTHQPTAFTAWLDLQGRPGELPIWIEQVEKHTVQPDPAESGTTVYRVRFRHFAGLVDEVLMRVYFDDQPGAQPVISGWSEIGTQVVPARTLGQGLGVANSDTVTIPAGSVDYVDIEAPGDGRAIRGVLAVAIRKAETREGLDFGGTAELTDPFGNGAPAVTGSDDVLLFGRVKATLEPGLVALTGSDAGGASSVVDFPLAKPPMIALLTFEILNVDVASPPHMTVNGVDAGPVSVTVPDLADPALTGEIAAARADAIFRYGGWLKCQKVIPGSLLKAGDNEVVISTPGDPSPVAMRAIEVQLKYTTNTP